ncbi:MAG: MATE family efflux transporter [Gammaproteobacteria bacterium]
MPSEPAAPAARPAPPPATHHDVWRIAAPLILSNISVPLLGMVDTAVMGHLDEPWYLGAVAVGATIFSFLYTGVNFLRMGTTGLAAQAFGAEDGAAVRTSIGQAVTVALAIAAVLIALQAPAGTLALSLLGPGPEVADYARVYFDVRIWSAPATLANYAIVGWFIGLQNARVPLAIVLTVNLTNILLDLVFVVGLGMKTEGVALASVLAEFTGLTVGLAFVARELRAWPGRFDWPALFRAANYGPFFSVNGNLFLRTMALMFALGFLTARSARLGDVLLAANAILINLQYLLSYALDGLAHAAEALVGKAMGQRSLPNLRRAVRLSLLWSLAVAVLFSVFYAAAGPTVIRILTELPEVIEASIRYLPWMVASPLVSVWSFLYDGVFVGATRAREMRNIMVLSAFGVFVPVWFVTQPWGNHGLWFAFLAFMAARGIGMHWYYRRLIARPWPG